MTPYTLSRRIAFLAVLTLVLALCLPIGGMAEDAPAFQLPPARGVMDMGGVDLSGAATLAVSADEDPFQLKARQSPAVQADSGLAVRDKALGLVGLPGMADTPADDSAYEKARRMQDGPNGTTRLTYGERYRRNPDGSYGAQSSSQWSGASNISDRLLEQALSAGSGYFSSWAEGWLGGYGKARISVRVNDEGEVTGAGDFLYPIYDSEYTTFFTQIGLRTMTGDRVIGNFGLGQRFFPAENFALGYNVFIDQDFSRYHTRGGAGVEAWYDWVRLSANYYTPLSGWKNSDDYDRRLVEERPAEGYDARLTGYLPFYRNLAVTGAFEQWKGDHVGSFGSDDVVQKDPKIWSYGLEWTPVPAFSTSVNQRHSGSQKETQFGLTFNYYFGMDWEDQISSAMVAEMRTVDGSRHDFINRQNEMILAYRAKEGVYNITLLRSLGSNRFEFQITNGFGEPVAGQVVNATLPAGVVDSGGGVYTTDANGLIRLELTTVPASAVPTVVTLTAGKTSKTFTLGSPTTIRNLIFTTINGGKFVESGDPGYIADTLGYQSTASATVTQYDDGSGATALPGGSTVVWSVKSAGTPSGGFWKRTDGGTKNGLTWGTDADGTGTWSADTVTGSPSSTDTAQLTDVVGSRSVTLEASVCIGGGGGETTEPACTGGGGDWYTDETTVSFGDGPLSVFNGTIGVSEAWSTQRSRIEFTTADGTDGNIFKAPVGTCSGTVYNRSSYIDGYTGVIIRDGTYWQNGDAGGSYSPKTNLPKVSQLLAVARYNGFYNIGVPRKGAAYAAGWTVGSYNRAWTGEVYFDGANFNARIVNLVDGNDDWHYVDIDPPAAVCLRP